MMLFDLIYGNVFENCRKIYKNEERFNGQKKKKKFNGQKKRNILS